MVMRWDFFQKRKLLHVGKLFVGFVIITSMKKADEAAL